MVDKAENSKIPEYQISTKSNIPKDSKDRDHLDKILNYKLSPVSNNYDKKEASLKSGSSLPRYAFRGLELIQCVNFIYNLFINN